ncbi:MAG: hypothetical protein V7738_16665 [Dietzia maris]
MRETYVIVHGETREEAEGNALRSGEGNPVLVQALRQLPDGGWIARDEVLLP